MELEWTNGMNNQQQLLQLSAKLFQLLETNPNGDERDAFLEEVDRLLEQRGQVLEALRDENYQLDKENKVHGLLIELDKGIRDRLDLVMQAVKKDMKNLQMAKQKEKEYINPYSSVHVLDGKYYDKKK